MYCKNIFPIVVFCLFCVCSTLFAKKGDINKDQDVGFMLGRYAICIEKALIEKGPDKGKYFNVGQIATVNYLGSDNVYLSGNLSGWVGKKYLAYPPEVAGKFGTLALRENASISSIMIAAYCYYMIDDIKQAMFFVKKIDQIKERNVLADAISLAVKISQNGSEGLEDQILEFCKIYNPIRDDAATVLLSALMRTDLRLSHIVVSNCNVDESSSVALLWSSATLAYIDDQLLLGLQRSELALKKDPRDLRVLSLYIQGLKVNNATQKAIACLEEFIKKYPKADVPYLLLGNILIYEDKFHTGISLLSQAVALSPNNPINQHALGAAMLGRIVKENDNTFDVSGNEFSDGLKHLELACRLTSFHVHYYIDFYCKALVVCNEGEKALGIVQRCLDDPAQPEGNLLALKKLSLYIEELTQVHNRLSSQNDDMENP